MNRLGKYEIVEEIGVGGFGVVYKGFDPLIKRHVAIKTCSAEDTETRERFRREAEIAGGLQHRNIVTVFEFGFEREVPYLVQEFLSGEDLDRKIKRSDDVPLPEKILWLVQIARGLEFAHSRGIVHRDVKPANIRILEDGTAKLLDFGIARLTHQTSNLTQAGMTLGTAAYLAPEQIRGKPVDSRTDLFSFGVLAYELLAFERPFRASEISAIFYKILHDKPPSLELRVPDLPPALEKIVLRCLEKDPEKRWAPTADLVHALETLTQRPASRSEMARTQILGSGAAPVTTGASRPPSPARKQGLDDLEIHHPHRSSRVESRSMATTAFGASSSRGRGRWIGFALGAIALAAGALFVAGGGRIPGLAEGDAGPATDANLPVVSSGSVPRDADSAAGAPNASASEAPAAPEPVEPAALDSTPLAPVEPEPAPEPGRIVLAAGWDPEIRVRVGGTRLRLDRQRSVELAPGSYTLVFTLDSGDYSDRAERRVRLGEGSTERIAVPLARPGRLTLQPHLGTRPGVVRIDGKMAGPAPLRNRRLPPGEHRIEIFPTSGVTAAPALTLPIQVRSGLETIVTFDLDGRLETQQRERPSGD